MVPRLVYGSRQVRAASSGSSQPCPRAETLSCDGRLVTGDRGGGCQLSTLDLHTRTVMPDSAVTAELPQLPQSARAIVYFLNISTCVAIRMNPQELLT